VQYSIDKEKMSFLFDDDNDDTAFSQNFLFSSQSQKQVTFSQSPSLFSPENKSALENFASPKLSQKSSLLTPKSEAKSLHKTNTFICQNCGAIDDYYHDAGGLATCNSCFTQSQHQNLEELDYDESQHMAGRNRDGTLKRIGGRNRSQKTNADGTALRGRLAVPLEDLDHSKKPPSLSACLCGFQAVLQKSCKILCLELLPTITAEVQSKNANVNAQESDSDESDANSYINSNNQKDTNSKQQKQNVYRQVSKTVKNLWKAYLLSWNEGADYYSKLYPQIRFAFRDQFLRPQQRTILYQTIAAKVEERLTEQIRKEVKQEEEEQPSSDSEDSDSSNESDSDGDIDSDDELYERRSNKKIKTETSELDSLCNLFDQGEKKIKLENVVSEDEIPIPDVVISNEPKTGILRQSKTSSHHYHSRQRRLPWNISIHDNEKNEVDLDSTHTDNEDEDSFTVASDLSILDVPEYKKKSISSRKRKRTKAKETNLSNTWNPYAKMIYHHNKLMHLKTKSKRIPMLGRKEAALLVKPSMELVLVMLLAAASPHGLTEGKLAEWVGNGSLPILDAFGCLLSDSQQEELAMLARFFSLTKAPDAAVLKFSTRKVHVACGYKPPTVKLQRRYNCKRKTTGRTLMTKSLRTAGRLVRPSSVPILLGYMVSELGLSQKVLNYSLALMGLPVAICALQAQEVPELQRTEQHGKKRLDVKADRDMFDLSDPAEVLRRKRYLAMLRKRRSRANRREMLGQTVNNYRFRNSDGRDKKIPVFVSSQNLHNKEKPLVNKENAEWLPPGLRSARPDKLGDVDQILAVVVVACKLTTNWEKNHHYVFSHGQENESTGDNQADDESKIGSFGDVKEESPDTSPKIFNVAPRDRFVPRNYEAFRRIGNRKTESEYLAFLEECIFRGNRHALPRFVESLNQGSSVKSEHHGEIYEDDYIKAEELDEVCSNSSLYEAMHHATTVVPNDVVLGWKKHSQLNVNAPPRDKPVPYQPTKSSDVHGLKKPGGPLGPLIEYMAYKTDTCPNRILDKLLELDKELIAKC